MVYCCVSSQPNDVHINTHARAQSNPGLEKLPGDTAASLAAKTFTVSLQSFLPFIVFPIYLLFGFFWFASTHFCCVVSHRQHRRPYWDIIRTNGTHSEDKTSFIKNTTLFIPWLLVKFLFFFPTFYICPGRSARRAEEVWVGFSHMNSSVLNNFCSYQKAPEQASGGRSDWSRMKGCFHRDDFECDELKPSPNSSSVWRFSLRHSFRDHNGQISSLRPWMWSHSCIVRDWERSETSHSSWVTTF